MHYSISRLPVIVVVLAATPISGTSGNVANASPGGPTLVKRTLCDNGFTFSKPTILMPNIEGYGWAECTAVPADAALTHNYYLSLQRRDASGQWQYMGAPTKSAIVPTARQTYTATAPCAPGVWRIFSNARGTIQGRPYDFSQNSDEKTVFPSDCG
ncbi:hypothetical protein OH799_22235 [Nocardia sp. NBC_00881]|uniref:hypothetical protein n=1 Tax=Nocardia sp. NBC_00881 TaxID=2975995 RepID=UPI00386D3014|nr:hypothetical protein OH799_22235 [Nocardia sp. NBC_00881]